MYLHWGFELLLLSSIILLSYGSNLSSPISILLSYRSILVCMKKLKRFLAKNILKLVKYKNLLNIINLGNAL